MRQELLQGGNFDQVNFIIVDSLHEISWVSV